MDRRLAWMVVLFGVLVVAGGILGFAKGSVASLASAGPLGLGIARLRPPGGPRRARGESARRSR